MTDHEFEVHERESGTAWICKTCGWLGTGCPSVEFANNEHAKIADDIRTGAVTTDPRYREFTV